MNEPKKTPSNEHQNSYYGQRVLVTGADGFIGSHLVEKLMSLGADVIPFVRSVSDKNQANQNFKNIIILPPKFKHVEWGDISSPDVIMKIFELKPDYIFHLAASAYVNHSFDYPMEVFSVNAQGTMNILEASRKLKQLKRTVVISSSEIYGSCGSETMDESHPLRPTSPYAASKVAADRLAYSFWKTFETPVVIVRPFNCYGPRHTYDVIPKFINLALSNKPLTIYGDGLQERDFTFVDDTVQGMIKCGQVNGIEGEVFNLGSGQSHSVLSLAKQIISLTGSHSEIIHTEARSAEVELLLADSTKAKKILNWDVTVCLESGLNKNIDWSMKNLTRKT